MAEAVTKHYDWVNIYKTIQKDAQIPGISSVKDRGSQFIFRDMFVELDDVLKAVTEATSAPVMVFVYADVVRMPSERNWALNNLGLFIAARRIDATTGTFFQLDYRTGGNDNGTFIAYATEIEGPLEVKVFTSQDSTNPIVYDLSQFDSLGVQIALQNGDVVKKNLTCIGEEALVLGKDLWMSLSNIFQFSAVVLDRQPDVASYMLRWIKAATAPSIVARDIYLQATALLSQLTLSVSEVNFVPYLSKNVYEDVVKEFEVAAVAYEDQYQRFIQEKENKDLWIEAANQMKNYFQQTSNFNVQLITQAEDNLKNAGGAVDEAKNHLNWQKYRVDIAAESFKTGVEIWKQDNEGHL